MFDFVVVGIGTAGSLLGRRLAADASKSVLLVEAGEGLPWWTRVPIAYLGSIGNPRVDWMFRTEPEAGLGGRVLRYPRGKTLGGCSAINGMLYVRGQSQDYDTWAELVGDDGWRWEKVRAYGGFDRSDALVFAYFWFFFQGLASFQEARAPLERRF